MNNNFCVNLKSLNTGDYISSLTQAAITLSWSDLTSFSFSLILGQNYRLVSAPKNNPRSSECWRNWADIQQWGGNEADNKWRIVEEVKFLEWVQKPVILLSRQSWPSQLTYLWNYTNILPQSSLTFLSAIKLNNLQLKIRPTSKSTSPTNYI